MLPLLLFVVCMTACSNRTEIPSGIIVPDSMRVIMKDVILADAYAETHVNRDTAHHDKLKTNQELLEAIFKLHAVTRADFRKSLDFYESRPDLNKQIFDSLSAYGNRHKTELYTPGAMHPRAVPPIPQTAPAKPGSASPKAPPVLKK